MIPYHLRESSLGPGQFNPRRLHRLQPFASSIHCPPHQLTHTTIHKSTTTYLDFLRSAMPTRQSHRYAPRFRDPARAHRVSSYFLIHALCLCIELALNLDAMKRQTTGTWGKDDRSAIVADWRPPTSSDFAGKGVSRTGRPREAPRGVGLSVSALGRKIEGS